MSSYAFGDVMSACSNFRSWGYLASKQIQFDYRRSFIGSLWIVLAFVLTATGIGALMAQLQGRPLQQHVPYVMFGFAAWNFVTGLVTGGCSVLANARPYLLQMPLARSAFVLSLTLRNLYLAVIHLAAAAAVSALLGWRPGMTVLWVIPALFMFAAAGFGTALLLGLLCARIPDLTQLVNSVMRLSFFFTPIIWVQGSGARDHAGGLIGALMQWNPFVYFVSSFRDGLLGLPASALHWYVSLGITLGVLIAGLTALQLLGPRITYWL